jgi:hypothetical protein
MRLILFALACLVTLLLIRFLQRSSAGSGGAGRADRPPRPAASDDEIVDVRFEEYPRPGPDGEKKP